MGGTLATRLAEVRPDDLAGLLLVNPALLTQRLDAKLLPLIARLTGSWAPIASDIKKPGVTELAYPKLPTRAMMQLRSLWAVTRADLARVTDAGDRLPQRRGPRRRADQHARCCWTASPAPTPPRSCCGTATTWPRSTTTPRRSSRARSTGSARTCRPEPAGGEPRGGGHVTGAAGDGGTTGWTPRSGARCGTSTRGSASTCSTCCTAVGIAAYLEPSSDVEPYTRSVSLPSPPSDRLFVDRARRAEARTVVDQHVPAGAESPRAGPGRPRPEPARAGRRPPRPGRGGRVGGASSRPSRPRTAAPSSTTRRPPCPIRPVQHEVPILDRPDEHYEPPPPPPLPVPAPASLYAVLLVAFGLLLVGAPGVLRLSADVGLILGVTAIAGGVAMLVSRMRDRSDDDGDDGAVV